ncbi:MFS transporter [Roseibium sp.]|uniref:MFS transporter n=1 Tax=Roseibium sp. TaxID=1936156 RepID=UPI003A977AE9
MRALNPAELENCPPAPRDLAPGEDVWITQGSRDYTRAKIALFLAGFASFSLIYCVQPLLPEFPAQYGVNAATASLALSLTTGMLAVSILISGALAQSVSRRKLMFGSMVMASVFNILAASDAGWGWLLAARAAEGFVLGGVPAIAITYLAEEIDPKSLGRAVGLYVGGTAFGAMVGRVGMGLVSAYSSWQTAMVLLGILCVATSVGFLLLLPPSRNFRPSRSRLSEHLAIWMSHLRNPALLRLYLIGTMLTSVFTTVFNYSTFRLVEPPYSLGRIGVSLLFVTYALGIFASAYGGALIDRLGRQTMLIAGFAITLMGLAATLIETLWGLGLGVSLITIGFFIGHAAASSGVGAAASRAKSHATALYLLFYYAGASITGWVGGWFWIHGGWDAVAALTAMCAVGGLALSMGTASRNA